MPIIHVNGIDIYYEDTKNGKDVIVLAHGLLFSCRMFDKQIELLKKKHRCVVFDFRGHGKSGITKKYYDIEMLYQDVDLLLKELKITSCNFVGLSMGGFIGMRLAVRKPKLIKSLILIGTSADPEPKENISKYKLLNFAAQWFGLKVVANRVMSIMFGKKFLNDQERAAEFRIWQKYFISNDRNGITKSVKAVINRKGVYDELSLIKCPTLIMVGDEDFATTPEKSMRIHKKIKKSKLKIIHGAGHTATVEEPEQVNKSIIDFLRKHKQ